MEVALLLMPVGHGGKHEGHNTASTHHCKHSFLLRNAAFAAQAQDTSGQTILVEHLEKLSIDLLTIHTYAVKMLAQLVQSQLDAAPMLTLLQSVLKLSMLNWVQLLEAQILKLGFQAPYTKSVG